MSQNNKSPGQNPVMDASPVLDEIRKEAERKYKRKWRVLAKRLGWSVSKVSKILSGEQSLRLVDFILLCQVLGVSAGHLLVKVVSC